MISRIRYASTIPRADEIAGQKGHADISTNTWLA
jgi:hypothetical protein